MAALFIFKIELQLALKLPNQKFMKVLEFIRRFHAM